MVCTECPFRNVSRHVEQSELIGFIGSDFCCIYGTVINIVPAKGLEVGKETALIVPGVGPAPGVHREIEASPCSIFPFCFKRQPVGLHVGNTVFPKSRVHVIGSPPAECLGLRP